MTKTFLFTLFFSLSAFATDPMTVPSTFDLGEIDTPTKTYVEASIPIKNDNMSATLPVVIGVLDNPLFNIQATTCTCNLLSRRTCFIKVRLQNPPRIASDYSLSTTLNVNGQVISISATVKAIVATEDPIYLRLNTGTPQSIDFGSISSPTSFSVYIYNHYGYQVPVSYNLPQGVTVTYNECPTMLLSRTNCTLTVSLDPSLTIDGLYNHEVLVMTPQHTLRIPTTALVTGGVPACLPAP